MLLLESLPTVIGTAAVAPALLILWLVVAADERPGPPAKVWTAFFLGAASISLLA
jgi:cell shape-determining protein MreD